MLAELEERPRTTVTYEHLREELTKLERMCAMQMVGSANSRNYKDCFNQVKVNCQVLAPKAKQLSPAQNPYAVLYNIAYAEWLSHSDMHAHWSKVMRAISVLKAEALSHV